LHCRDSRRVQGHCQRGACANDREGEIRSTIAIEIARDEHAATDTRLRRRSEVTRLRAESAVAIAESQLHQPQRSVAQREREIEQTIAIEIRHRLVLRHQQIRFR
jgi:hypothetical protein